RADRGGSVPRGAQPRADAAQGARPRVHRPDPAHARRRRPPALRGAPARRAARPRDARDRREDRRAAARRRARARGGDRRRTAAAGTGARLVRLAGLGAVALLAFGCATARPSEVAAFAPLPGFEPNEELVELLNRRLPIMSEGSGTLTSGQHFYYIAYVTRE